MSAASDKFERDIGKNLNELIQQIDRKGYAERPAASTEYADVEMEFRDKRTWCEIKMNHTDNLSNPRVFYRDGEWQTAYKTPVAKYAVDILNKSKDTQRFIEDIAKFSGIPLSNLKIPTTKSGLHENGAVPLATMKRFFSKVGVNHYIAEEKNYDLGKIVTEHYTIGKKEPAHYMQAKDDFYMISDENPFGFRGVPLLKGIGDFRVRIATRSLFYEVQAEIKIKHMANSKFSVAGKTKKKNPFDTIK